jgi:hypothetical protein
MTEDFKTFYVHAFEVMEAVLQLFMIWFVAIFIPLESFTRPPFLICSISLRIYRFGNYVRQAKVLFLPVAGFEIFLIYIWSEAWPLTPYEVSLQINRRTSGFG